MTRDDIDDLMRDNGIVVVGEAVYALCQLVAAAEREKVAAWMIARGYATGHGDTVDDLLKELEWQIRESEREACAKVVEAIERNGAWVTKAEAAAAIRARGKI
jgi:hypothetical protein